MGIKTLIELSFFKIVIKIKIKKYLGCFHEGISNLGISVLTMKGIHFKWLYLLMLMLVLRGLFF